VDLSLLPHFDLHVLTGAGTPRLVVDVILSSVTDLDQTSYTRESIRASSRFTFFAPHNQVGQRLDQNILPSIDPATGIVTATVPGIYLFQVDCGGVGSLVGRLQVHGEILDWWFGNDSMTTAKDDRHAHARPTIYARFPEHPSGTDVVGDITGHNYVQLTSADPTKVVVAPPDPVHGVIANDRLRGVIATEVPVTVRGTLAGKPPNELKVRVFDYAITNRRQLDPVRVRDVPHASDRSNIVFLAEGFRAEDKELFTSVVRRTTKEMFDKPRHQPYGLLADSFNVFMAFVPSQEQLLTCGFRVTDNTVGLDRKGVPIPWTLRMRKVAADNYSLAQLIERVGLPKRGENRAPKDLRDDWKDRSFPNFVPKNVSDDLLINTWKVHQSDGALQARDTAFGLILGGRWADGSRNPGLGTAAARYPAADTPTPELAAYIDRLHDFYRIQTIQGLQLDPRRHAPEVYASSLLTNPGNLVLQYLAGLAYSQPPNTPVGQNWIPVENQQKRSRGLVSVIAYDDVQGGQSINKKTLTAVTFASLATVATNTPVAAHPLLTRRVPPPPVTPANPGLVLDDLINLITHEFGHSFNLGDEYELSGADQDPGDATEVTDPLHDNISRIGFLKIAAPPDRHINPNLVKWLELPRMRISSRLLISAAPGTDAIELTVGRDEIGKWTKVWQDGTDVSLRNATFDVNRRQLPLKRTSSFEFVEGLRIKEKPNAALGTLLLTFPRVRPPAIPVFSVGSAVYVPLKDANGAPLLAVDQKVAAFLRDTTNPRGRLPLNKNILDNTIPIKDPDLPVDIPGFTPPNNAYRLVGIFEGGENWSRGFYRPTGACKMRDQNEKDDKQEDEKDLGKKDKGNVHGQFCFVCKWLIVNLVDPGQHQILHDQFYPR
jgi:hypothetical protein